jgi:hypothetical protein
MTTIGQVEVFEFGGGVDIVSASYQRIEAWLLMRR